MRFNLVGIIIGMRGTGKTLFLLGSEFTASVKDKALKIVGLLSVWINGGFKVLIIDTLDHPAYRNIAVLQQKDFAAWRKGVVRVFLEPDAILKLVDLINRSPHMNNTAIVFEDAVKYCGSNLPKPIQRLLVDSKQRNIDVLFMFHSFIDTPNNIFTKADFIQLFKTQDGPEVRRKNMRLYDYVVSQYNDVKANPSNFYSRYIDTRTN